MHNDDKSLKPEWVLGPVSAPPMRQSCQQTWGHRNCTFVLRLFSAYLAPTVWLASTESDFAWVPVSADLEQKEFNIVFEPMTQFWIMFLPLFFLVSRRISDKPHYPDREASCGGVGDRGDQARRGAPVGLSLVLSSSWFSLKYFKGNNKN